MSDEAEIHELPAQAEESAEVQEAIDAAVNISPAEAMAMIDDDPSTIPPIPWQPLLTVWGLQPSELPDGLGVVITIANQAFPGGISFILEHERALKFTSQIKKAVQGGPQLAVPPKKKLIVPGR